MEFLKSTELSQNAAGYLISKTTGLPVTHKEFVEQQRVAEYICKLSVAIKDANFTVNKIDSLESIKESVRVAIADTKQQYVTAPTKPTSSVNEEMIKFALDFNSYTDQKVVNEKINTFMQMFNKISDVESVGDYFSEGVEKLNKVYSISEILAAVTSNVNKLGNL